jgi:hypothetical protein
MASCDGPRAIVVLSVGSRPFLEITRPLMELYAERVSATLHIVTSDAHPSLAPWRERLKATPRFLKLPLLDYHLQRYARVMLLDDDVVISPHADDLFRLTPCDRVGAVRRRALGPPASPAGASASHPRQARTAMP